MIEELAGNSGAYWGIREIIEKEIQEISIATQHSVTEHQGEKISIFSYFQRRTVLWQPVMEFPLQWTLSEVNFETTAPCITGQHKMELRTDSPIRKVPGYHCVALGSSGIINMEVDHGAMLRVHTFKG
jgi:hypothetical protein